MRDEECFLLDMLDSASPPSSDGLDFLVGKFLVLDGTEGAGKSTQSKMLRDHLVALGLDVLAVRDPGSTDIGEKVRQILLDPASSEMAMRCEMLLYMSARAQMMAQVILPALQAAKTVICDRFVSSTLAYQLGGDGLTAQEIRAVADVAIRGRWPDLTLILDMPPDKSLARVTRARDRIEQRPIAYHEQVRRNYLALAQADPRRYRVVRADQPLDQVHSEILTAVQSLA